MMHSFNLPRWILSSMSVALFVANLNCVRGLPIASRGAHPAWVLLTHSGCTTSLLNKRRDVNSCDSSSPAQIGGYGLLTGAVNYFCNEGSGVYTPGSTSDIYSKFGPALDHVDLSYESIDGADERNCGYDACRTAVNNMFTECNKKIDMLSIIISLGPCRVAIHLPAR